MTEDMNKANQRLHLCRNIAIATWIFCSIGCAFTEESINERIPVGVYIPLSGVPLEVVPEDARDNWDPRTEVYRCNDGELYRIKRPDGTQWFKNKDGKTVGAIF